VCRLSIIVPYDRDEAAFEATLVSVLENRPEFCEVIVAHDGSYCDPFDLGDEVRFVIGDSPDAKSLLKTAINASLGRIVHFLASGARATEGWSEEPIEMFEQADLACVAPVIRDLSAGGRVVAAGWRDTSTGLRRPIAAGCNEPGRKDIASVQGGYLAASFWRRSVLEAIANVDLTEAISCADYVWMTAARESQWRCRVAPTSSIIASPQIIAPIEGVRQANQVMQMIRSGLKGEGLGRIVIASLINLALNPVSASRWLECVGRVSGQFNSTRSKEIASTIREVSESAGPHANQTQILSMPKRDYGSMRRAA
jgi:hypothetical protein